MVSHHKQDDVFREGRLAVKLSHQQDKVSPGPLSASAAGCAPPADAERALGVAVRYVRLTGPVLRGPAGVIIAVASFALGAAVGGRGGLAIASVYVTVIGMYCLLNFLQCRETHCCVTGPGFTLAALLGFAAALVPGPALSWYRTGPEAAVYLVVLAAGYALEWAVAARTGRRTLR
jgi:hypothetical protein